MTPHSNFSRLDCRPQLGRGWTRRAMLCQRRPRSPAFGLAIGSRVGPCCSEAVRCPLIRRLAPSLRWEANGFGVMSLSLLFTFAFYVLGLCVHTWVLCGIVVFLFVRWSRFPFLVTAQYCSILHKSPRRADIHK